MAAAGPALRQLHFLFSRFSVKQSSDEALEING
jgi:hypothetical protein